MNFTPCTPIPVPEESVGGEKQGWAGVGVGRVGRSGQRKEDCWANPGKEVLPWTLTCLF